MKGGPEPRYVVDKVSWALNPVAIFSPAVQQADWVNHYTELLVSSGLHSSLYSSHSLFIKDSAYGSLQSRYHSETFEERWDETRLYFSSTQNHALGEIVSLSFDQKKLLSNLGM